ncbi:liprin-beta-1 isoform X2 [Sitodiplosis mosellana]|uniref:liprin-beta-1 isoform X2 n=1 Tax=Sitodiplosis mosellana TaxID=263140 RepID=UPI0024440463|nr:liprin-beta-1 isoform X2 [Sitodiplosis mosellana]
MSGGKSTGADDDQKSTIPASLNTNLSEQSNYASSTSSRVAATTQPTAKSKPDHSNVMSSVLIAAKKLSILLQQNGNMAHQPDPFTANILSTWLQQHLPRQSEGSDERLRLLQNDKELLAHQVHMLSEQVSAQNEKINDLERLITDKAQHVSTTEDLLQRERLTRSSLETQKLELMSAMSELKLQQAVLERENLELRASHFNNNTIATDRRLPPVPNTRIRTNSSSGSMTPPSTYRRQQVDIHYNSLPRASAPTTSTPIQSASSSANNSSSIDSNANPKRNAVAFGKQLMNQYIPHSATKSASNICHQQMVLCQQPEPTSTSPSLCDGFQKQKGVSVPNLAQTEKIIDDIDVRQQSSPSPCSMSSKSKSLGGLRSIFGKLRRSNSGNLEDLPLDGGEFRRGGIRATAGPRLGWSGAPTTDIRLNNERSKPFAEWSVDAVCGWFEEMGLGIYEDDLKKWLKNGGSDLINCSSLDIEKEINLKSALHRKKIVLALLDVTGKDTDELFVNSGKLDMVWVMRWLDDIGLPQHKDAFSNARIDGRMLHRLTLEDLATLHVTSSLHAASLRRAIQVMRENKWNPDCLVRRSYNQQIDDEKVYSPSDLLKDIHLWTAHRVMEWLRVVNLAEYAPNLRGAGVHGALMVYEDRFTDELLADLLSIPATKSLIRRHLCTHFKDLLGRDIIQNKRKAETTLGYQPLTLTSKIKTPKKSQFTLKRKKNIKPSDEWGDLVCPIGASDEESSTANRRRGCFSGE